MIKGEAIQEWQMLALYPTVVAYKRKLPLKQGKSKRHYQNLEEEIDVHTDPHTIRQCIFVIIVLFLFRPSISFAYKKTRENSENQLNKSNDDSCVMSIDSASSRLKYTHSIKNL